MLRSYPLLTAFFCLSIAVKGASATAESISEIATQFPHAQFIEDNAMGLNFRLSLLDYAAPGSQVRIATFTYESGAATRKLNAHICSATARGVNVELIVDAKSGGALGVETPYNADPKVQQNERDYLSLANCGAKVYVHNYSTDYVNVSLLKKRIPNIFGADVRTGSTVLPTALLGRLKQLRLHLANGLKTTLTQNHLSVDPSNLLANLQDLILQMAQLPSVVGQNSEDPVHNPLEGAITVMSRDYKEILNDPFWAQFDPSTPNVSIAKMKAVSGGIKSLLLTDPVLKEVRNKLRVFNRLNHRKLFTVQEPSGETCIIVGGRNLGDDYLTTSKTSFRDGDIFLCSRHVQNAQALFKQANDSLDSLKSDTNDPAVKDKVPTKTLLLKATKKATGARTSAIAANTLQGIDLGEMGSPILLTSNWDPSTDGVKFAMLEGILRETKELYIESAYAEFNADMREALEKALNKGVKVRVVTNGLFISDAGSKMIRPWMARWNYEMGAKYPKLFKVQFAPLSAGHMIHFKGAAFRCQAGAEGMFYRQYIVGSHNFHPRSGYSDKEHALEWRVPTDASCPEPEADLITIRDSYYKTQLAKNHGRAVLVRYTSMLEEIQEATAMFDDPKSADFARVLERTMYLNGELVLARKLSWIEDLLDRGGLRDLIGILF